MTYGEAVAHGAATIVNAIATGKGAAFGINLKTKAKVELTKDIGVIRGKILPETEENTILIEKAVLTVLKHFGVEKQYGALVETQSNIPIAKGLKSSSVASNAVVLATAKALSKSLADEKALSLSVDAAFQAKTTVTGAFDDASASFFGNVVVTDNLQRLILKRDEIEHDYHVLIHIPHQKSYTIESDVKKMKLITQYVEYAFQEALKGNYWKALTLNGILYSSILGYSLKPVFDALNAGALAAGLSGKGPAVVAVVKGDGVDTVLAVWKTYKSKVLKAKINRKKAYVVEEE